MKFQKVIIGYNRYLRYKGRRGWFWRVWSCARAKQGRKNSHACTEMVTFLPETREENPFLGLQTKNVSQKIRQRQFCTNRRFSQRWIWLPMLSIFRNELTFWSVRWRHLMVKKNDEKSRFSSRVSGKISGHFCACMRKR